MKRALIISLIIHTVGFAILLFGIGDPFRFMHNEAPPIIIDFSTVGMRSMAKKLSPTNEKKADALKTPEKPKETDTSPPPVEETKVEEKKPQPKEEPKKEVNPDAVKLGKKIDKKPKKDEKNQKKNPDPKKEKPKKETSKKSDATLINLKKAKKTDKNKRIDTKAKSAEKALDDLMDNLTDQDGNSEASAPADTVGDTLVATEIQAVVATISKCWFIQAGSQGVLDTPVYITLHMNEDGTVRKAEIEDTKRLARDPIFRTAAESAQRAALDPRCNPLPLNPKRYSSWKTLALDFNPSAMAGISGSVR